MSDLKINLALLAKTHNLNGNATEQDLQVVFQVLRRAQGKIFDGQQGQQITKCLIKIAQDAKLDLSKVAA